MSHHDDHDHAPEPIPGLPEYLPEGEEILWQGSPDTGSFLRHVLHLRKIAGYFSLILLATLAFDIASGVAVPAAIANALSLGVVALLPIGMLWVIGRGMARSTIYTLTNRRLVLRFGLALPITVNVPFEQIHGADARLWNDGTGDIPLALTAGAKGMNYAVMWPHARPWTWLRTQPALRCVPDAERVARMVGEAWGAATGLRAEPAAAAPKSLAGSRGLEPAHR